MPLSGSGSASGVVAAGGSVSRRSLRTYRHLLARALNSLTLVTTTAAGDLAGTSLVASALGNSVDSNRYRHTWWLLTDGANAGALRRVGNDALNVSTGELVVSRSFGGQVAAGVTAEGHRMLPPEDDDGWTGLRSILNRALAELWFPQRLVIVGVSGQPSYPFGSYDWLDPEAIRELRGPALDSTLSPSPWPGFHAYRSGEAVTLEVAPPFQTGPASTLELYRPGDTYLRVGGVWGDSTEGLVHDTDEALFQPEIVIQVALVHAYEALAGNDDNSPWRTRAVAQRAKANATKLMMLNHDQRRPRDLDSTWTFQGLDHGWR